MAINSDGVAIYQWTDANGKFYTGTVVLTIFKTQVRLGRSILMQPWFGGPPHWVVDSIIDPYPAEPIPTP